MIRPAPATEEGNDCACGDYERSAPSAFEVVNACEVLMNAGFSHEALVVLARVLPGVLGGTLKFAEARYAQA